MLSNYIISFIYKLKDKHNCLSVQGFVLLQLHFSFQFVEYIRTIFVLRKSYYIIYVDGMKWERSNEMDLQTNTNIFKQIEHQRNLL